MDDGENREEGAVISGMDVGNHLHIPRKLQSELKVLSGSTIMHHGTRIRAYYAKACSRKDAQKTLAYLGKKFRRKPSRYSLALRTSDKLDSGHSGGVRGQRLQNLLQRFDSSDAILIVFEWEEGASPSISEAKLNNLVMQAGRNLLSSITSAQSSARLPKIVHRSARGQLSQKSFEEAGRSDASSDPKKSIRGYGPQHPLRGYGSIQRLHRLAKTGAENPYVATSDLSMVRKSNAWTGASSLAARNNAFSPCRRTPVPLMRRQLRVKPLAQRGLTSTSSGKARQPWKRPLVWSSTNEIEQQGRAVNDHSDLSTVSSVFGYERGNVLNVPVKPMFKAKPVKTFNVGSLLGNREVKKSPSNGIKPIASRLLNVGDCLSPLACDKPTSSVKHHLGRPNDRSNSKNTFAFRMPATQINLLAPFTSSSTAATGEEPNDARVRSHALPALRM